MKTNIIATALICNPDGCPKNESLLLELERIGVLPGMEITGRYDKETLTVHFVHNDLPHVALVGDTCRILRMVVEDTGDKPTTAAAPSGDQLTNPEAILLRAVMTRDFADVKAANPEFKAAKESLIGKGLLRQSRSGVIELNISNKYLKEFHYEKHA